MLTDRRRPLQRWLANGDALIWLNASAIGLLLLLAAGLIGLIAARGLVAFWPAPSPVRAAPSCVASCSRHKATDRMLKPAPMDITGFAWSDSRATESGSKPWSRAIEIPAMAVPVVCSVRPPSLSIVR